MKLSSPYLAGLILVLGAAPAGAELKIEHIQANYGRFGPARDNLTLSARDQVFLTFDILGIRTSPAGAVEGSIDLRVTNAKGKIVLENTNPIKGTLIFGGQRLPGSASLSFDEEVPEGEYTLTVTVHDAIGKEKASFQRSVTCANKSLAIVAPQFFADADGKFPVPLLGVAGQTMHFRLKAVNFDRSQGKIDALMTVQALDPTGNEPLSKPITAQIREDNPDTVKRVTHLSFNGLFSLNRPGDFRLKLTVKDNLTAQSTTLTLPLRVVPLAGPHR